MGRWSRHPMGSDGAYDARDEFFSEFSLQLEDEKDEDESVFWFEQPSIEIREYLNSLTVEDLKRLCENEILSEDRFVIPYIYKEYDVTPKDDDIKQFLLECFDYHDDITGEWNYCGETDENGEVLELKHIRFFRENFDAIMSGKIDLPDDEGLFAAIFK